MDNAASQVKNRDGFDGNISEEDAKDLAEFNHSNLVSSLSIALAELLICIEWQNEKKVPEMRETAVYNSLLRLEKAAHYTSSWELYGQDDDGPLFDLTPLEVTMIEDEMSKYIVELLSANIEETLFFPLDDFYSSCTIVKWRILEKIATIKLLPSKAVYKEQLKKHLQERLKNEVSAWLNKEIEKLKLSGSHTVRKDVEVLTKILKDLQNHITMAMDVTLTEVLFKEAECSYLDILSETLDNILFPITERIMQMMDSYQVRHKDFHVNMRDSCALSHSLYLQLKKLSSLLTTQSGTELNLRLTDYNRVFIKFFMNLLQVIKLECHFRVKRAVQAEMKDNVHSEEKILSSSVIVLNCICTVIDEWKHLEIEDEEHRIAFLVKITDIICDGVKIFAESLDCRLQTMSTPTKDLESLKKVCVLANSIEHVHQYLQELPQQMQWSEILEGIGSDLSDSTLQDQVLRILKLIHDSMNRHVMEIMARILSTIAACVQNYTEKQLVSWLQSQMPNQAFEKFFAHLNDILESMDETLKETLFPQMLSCLWSFLIPSIEKSFFEGLPPEYAKTVKENVLGLQDYFRHINMQEVQDHKPHLQKLTDLLDLNSKTTEELLLDYYVQIAETVVSPVEYLGHIAFQAGYKTSGNYSVDLYINVQKGQRLPARKLEMSQLTVKIELCPSTLFPTYYPLKTFPVTEDLDNPVFNDSFKFSKLPADVLNVKGAAVQVLVFNQDYSYSAEAILLLNQVQNMSGIVSLEFLPVYLMPLRKFDMSHISYQVLENRSRWDKNAKVFINKRAKLSKSQKKFLPCIPGKNIMCSFSRND